MATLTAVAMIAVLMAVTVGVLCVGSAVVARHRAQAAADLAAVAAAGGLVSGAEAACARAATVAQAMQTSMADCVVDGLDVVVTVEAAVPMGRLEIGPARAVARGGPAG